MKIGVKGFTGLSAGSIYAPYIPDISSRTLDIFSYPDPLDNPHPHWVKHVETLPWQVKYVAIIQVWSGNVDEIMEWYQVNADPLKMNYWYLPAIYPRISFSEAGEDLAIEMRLRFGDKS